MSWKGETAWHEESSQEVRSSGVFGEAARGQDRLA